MRLAITYENNEVFAHFGKTKEFKIYEIEEGKVTSSEVVSCDGAGHEVLANVLEEMGIEVLICGGIGSGAQSALMDAGIDFVAGVKGNCDEAVERYLNGELEDAGVNCHCHEDGHGCDCGEKEEVGGCGHCGGGCHRKPSFEGPNVGKTVRTHYKGTFDNGEEFDSSYKRNEPLEFVCGAGQMILGFDKAVATMEVGQTIQIHLMPEEAYGEKDPDAIIDLPIENLPGAEDLNEGQQVYLQNAFGMPFKVTVLEKDEKHIVLDANHEMAGKELNFEITLVEIL